MESLTCSECGHNFNALYNLKKHAKKYHPDKVERIVTPLHRFKFLCEICGDMFHWVKDFKSHMAQHSSTRRNKKCPLCTYKNPSKMHIWKHFAEVHNINIVEQNVEFASWEEFIEWKNTLEEATNFRYIKTSGTTCHNGKTNTEFVCHRSGTFVSRSADRRHMKTQGTNKINAYCPGAIKITTNSEGICQVRLIDTHVGHEGKDFAHLPLTTRQREDLAAKIAMKIPFMEIIDEVRTSLTDGSQQLERIHLLTRKDLLNIEQTFNLQSSAVHHHNDGISVEAFITQMNASGCVLFYKAQETLCNYPQLKYEDFMLIIMNSGQEEMLKKYGTDCICIDGTHGLNQYDFELHTLLVLDDLREGFPCAFLISNRSDEAVFNIFFACIKQRIGGPILAKVFMSDMANAYYNAYQMVMGVPTFRLFCSWHVDRAWQKNLTKITSIEKRGEVYKYLRAMMQETTIPVFNEMLTRFLQYELTEPDTSEFLKYFKLNYTNNVNSWAYCFRINSGLNTNMHIERMHRTIKYIYFQGRKVKRLDKAIHVILRFVRDKFFNRLIAVNRGKLCTKITELRKRHQISEQLDVDNVIENGTGWEIPSTMSSLEIYRIEKNLNIVCDCKLMCTDCNACIHQYSCTCIDSCVKWNMCKHIHLLCRYLKRRCISTIPMISDDQEPDRSGQCALAEESTMIVEGLQIGQVTKSADTVVRRREKLRMQLNKLLDGVTCVDEIEVFEKLTAPIAPTLSAIKNKKTAMREKKCKVSANAKINPQRRLFSTKKKKQKRVSTLSKPTREEVEEIALSTIFSRD